MGALSSLNIKILQRFLNKWNESLIKKYDSEIIEDLVTNELKLQKIFLSSLSTTEISAYRWLQGIITTFSSILRRWNY